MTKILITGGSGRLGIELKKYLAGNYVNTSDFDFTKKIPKHPYDLIIHAGAYTNVRRAEFNSAKKCFLVNVYGTFNLVRKYKQTPFIYISSEYAHNPTGVYALSKKLGEEVVKTHPRHLIIRTSFKPNPFPFKEAYIDQYTQGDYVNVIAKLLAKKVKKWNRKTCKLEYLGTGRKTIFTLAKKTRPNVLPISVEDFIRKTGVPIPKDYE